MTVRPVRRLDPKDGRKLQTYQNDLKPTFCLLPILWTAIVITMTKNWRIIRECADDDVEQMWYMRPGLLLLTCTIASPELLLSMSFSVACLSL